MVADAKTAKSARGRRFLKNREAKLNENPKTALIVRGQKTSGLINDVLTDLYMLKKPLGVHMRRHNAVHPFEDATPLEFLSQKNDASLFAFGTHSKKRPHNLVFGRMFDHHVLDMVELGVTGALAPLARRTPRALSTTPIGRPPPPHPPPPPPRDCAGFKKMAAFPQAGGGCSTESKPCLLFSGAAWEHDANLVALRSVLLDFFLLKEVDAISSIGVEHLIVFTAATESTVLLRHYLVRLKKSAEGTGPYTELVETGPSLDLAVRRTHHASEELMKQATIKPKAGAAAPKKVKNVEHGRLSGKQGRLHMPKQNLNEMALARPKALRKTSRVAGGGEGEAGVKRPRTR